ncbi:hypothetical protein C7S14_5670 [Burkholderia cepacia]|nr:hypothetical protein C7S14_5670 [Burkholderia cepacia]
MRQASRACAHHNSELDGAAARRAAPLWRLGPVQYERWTPGRADSVRRECRRKGAYCSTAQPSVRDNAANGPADRARGGPGQARAVDECPDRAIPIGRRIISGVRFRIVLPDRLAGSSCRIVLPDRLAGSSCRIVVLDRPPPTRAAGSHARGPDAGRHRQARSTLPPVAQPFFFFFST